jgi:hypothetical protein
MGGVWGVGGVVMGGLGDDRGTEDGDRESVEGIGLNDQVGVICQHVNVIELDKRRLFIYIPYAKDQIWTFNLVYIYDIR